MQVPTKPWYKSKTLWVNILGGLVLVLDYLGTIGVEETWIASLLVVLNMVLRFLTDQPVTVHSHSTTKYVAP